MPDDATLILPTFYMCLICPFKLGVSLIKDVFLRYQHPVILEMVQLSSFQFIKEKQKFDL